MSYLLISIVTILLESHLSLSPSLFLITFQLTPYCTSLISSPHCRLCDFNTHLNTWLSCLRSFHLSFEVNISLKYCISWLPPRLGICSLHPFSFCYPQLCLPFPCFIHLDFYSVPLKHLTLAHLSGLLAFTPCCSLFLEYISSLLKKLLRDWVFSFPQKPRSLLVLSCLVSIIIVQTTTQSLLSRSNIFFIVCVKLLHSHLTLCNPMDCSLPGFSLHGVLQARILECAVMTSSGVSSWPKGWTHASYVPCIGEQVLYH